MKSTNASCAERDLTQHLAALSASATGLPRQRAHVLVGELIAKLDEAVQKDEGVSETERGLFDELFSVGPIGQAVALANAEMGTAAAEQTTGVGQVNTAVSELDRATQQNAGLVEESAAAAESLRSQAAKLAEVVGYFKVSEA